MTQKYLGDWPKLLQESFQDAEEHVSFIIFIDEIDAIGTKEYYSDSGVREKFSQQY